MADRNPLVTAKSFGSHGGHSEPWFFHPGTECPRLAESAQRGYPLSVHAAVDPRLAMN